jgi:hypothetical protein
MPRQLIQRHGIEHDGDEGLALARRQMRVDSFADRSEHLTLRRSSLRIRRSARGADPFGEVWSLEESIDPDLPPLLPPHSPEDDVDSEVVGPRRESAFATKLLESREDCPHGVLRAILREMLEVRGREVLERIPSSVEDVEGDAQQIRPQVRESRGLRLASGFQCTQPLRVRASVHGQSFAAAAL